MAYDPTDPNSQPTTVQDYISLGYSPEQAAKFVAPAAAAPTLGTPTPTGGTYVLSGTPDASGNSTWVDQATGKQMPAGFQPPDPSKALAQIAGGQLVPINSPEYAQAVKTYQATQPSSALGEIGQVAKEALPGTLAVLGAGTLGNLGMIPGVSGSSTLGSAVSSALPGATGGAAPAAAPVAQNIGIAGGNAAFDPVAATAAGAGGGSAVPAAITGGTTLPGLPSTGVDQVGSDFSAGTANMATPGGLLPTTAGGLTAANLAAGSGVPGSVNSGLSDVVSSIGPQIKPGGVTVPTGTGGSSTGGTGGTSGTGAGLNLGSTAGIASLLPGLGAIGLASQKPNLDTKNLSDIAMQLSGPGSLADLTGKTATSLVPSVSTGNLPPGAQTEVHNAVEDAKNSIRAHYANLGISGSTMEGQELAAADARGQAMSFDMANKLTQTGLTAAGMSAADLGQSAGIYQNILAEQLKQDEALQAALAEFASASAIGVGLASGGTGGAGTNVGTGLAGGFGNFLKSLGITSGGATATPAATPDLTGSTIDASGNPVISTGANVGATNDLSTATDTASLPADAYSQMLTGL